MVITKLQRLFVGSLLEGCQKVARGLSDGCQRVINVLSEGCHIIIEKQCWTLISVLPAEFVRALS